MRVSIEIPDWAEYIVSDLTDIDRRPYKVDANKVKKWFSGREPLENALINSYKESSMFIQNFIFRQTELITSDKIT